MEKQLPAAESLPEQQIAGLPIKLFGIEQLFGGEISGNFFPDITYSLNWTQSGTGERRRAQTRAEPFHLIGNGTSVTLGTSVLRSGELSSSFCICVPNN